MKKAIGMMLILVLATSLMVTGFADAQSQGGGNNQGRAVAWSPEVLDIVVFTGTTQSYMVEFIASRELEDVSLSVVPELADMLSVHATGLDYIPSGERGELTATLDIDSSTPLGRYDGTVHLEQGRRVVPDTLKVVINVVAATSTDVPTKSASPSSDRITTDEGQKLVKDEIVVMLDFETADPNERIVEIASSTNGVIMGAVPATLTYQLRYDVPDLEALEDVRLLLESLPDVEAASHHFLADLPAASPNDADYYTFDEQNSENDNWNPDYTEVLSDCSECHLLDTGEAPPYTYGDIPLDEATYQKYLKRLDSQEVGPMSVLPPAYDARDDGIVTPARDQERCGSCWAHAAVGAIESHLLKAGLPFDPGGLSVQQQVSCNLDQAGCCGGTMESLRFWEHRGPVYETCFPYGDAGTRCPTPARPTRTVPCSDGESCRQLRYRVTNYYTVAHDQFRQSLHEHGPSYWRYTVYQDFRDWYRDDDTPAGDVYVNADTTEGNRELGGHAVLIIGWDDDKGAYLMQNSWNATSGPQGDGTFWIAYSGHHRDLEFGMANFEVSTRVYPNDTEYDSWDEDNPGGNNWNLEYIKAPSAWSMQTGSSSVVVGVIDGDFDRNHGDLAGNVLSWSGPRTPDFNGHGTHVAGIAGAVGNNNRGVTGVAWDVSLRLYEVGDRATLVRAQELMVQAVDDGCRVINGSFGFIDTNRCIPGTARTLQRVAEANAVLGRAILYAQRENKDVLWVFAAGNECRDAMYQSPASLTMNFPLNTVAVAAVGRDGNLASFSNRGELVTVAAPGVDILSTVPRFCVWFVCRDRYRSSRGTSMAAPHVSGLAALIMSEHPDKSATEVKQCIVASAVQHGPSVPGHDFRVIHAEEAVLCSGTVPLPDKVDLVLSIDLTGSMGGAISRLKLEIDTIITNLETIVSPTTDFRFGVVSHEDYHGYFDSTPCGSSYAATYGGAGDQPFRIDRVLTYDTDAVKSTIAGLTLRWGGDGPESYGRVFWEVSQADTGEILGWRTDALKLLVAFGDNVPHDTDLNEGVADPPYSTFDTGIDPGRSGIIHCGGDDIDFQDDALAAMVASDIRLLYVHSGSTILAPYWQYWTSVTGGAFAQINPDGSVPGDLDLTEVIIALLRLMP